jgi:hypothetical protein
MRLNSGRVLYFAHARRSSKLYVRGLAPVPALGHLPIAKQGPSAGTTRRAEPRPVVGSNAVGAIVQGDSVGEFAYLVMGCHVQSAHRAASRISWAMYERRRSFWPGVGGETAAERRRRRCRRPVVCFLKSWTLFEPQRREHAARRKKKADLRRPKVFSLCRRDVTRSALISRALPLRKCSRR